MRKTPKRFTGICPTCRRRLGIDGDGAMNVHNGTVHYDRGGTRFCWGSRRMATEGSKQEDDSVAPTFNFVWGQ